MKQATTRELALFKCVQCDHEQEILMPALETPLEWWPKCVYCGVAIWLMHIFTAAF